MKAYDATAGAWVAFSAYDNTSSNLVATTTQAAIDELSTKQMYIDDDDVPQGYIQLISRDGHLVIQQEAI